MDFEDQLRSALERKRPPADFVSRVVAAAGSGSTRAAARATWRRWVVVPIAASILVLAVGLGQQQERRERAQGEAAKAQLMQALRITSGKLERIQSKLKGVLQ